MAEESRRNLFVLAACQALGMSASSMVLVAGGLVGARMAPAPVWATLPVASMVVGVAAASAPAAFFMKRFGRRTGFIAGASLGVLAAAAGFASLVAGAFAVFCAAAAFVGCSTAFVLQYRFAAAESVAPEAAGRAVSTVLLGGLVAGILGPELATMARSWLPRAEFAGSFAALAALDAIAVVLLLFLVEPAKRRDVAAVRARSPAGLMRRPAFRVAVLAGVVAYGVMSLSMSAAPVSMHVIDGHSVAEAAAVIQSHIVAMYLPSLLTGFLVARLGLRRLMLAGTGLLAAACLVAPLGHEIGVYWVGLVLLGLGWNFLFIGGTTMLARTYLPEERFHAQALNDFSIFTAQAAVSLLAGTLLFLTGWSTLNLLALPALAVVAAALLTLRAVPDAAPTAG